MLGGPPTGPPSSGCVGCLDAWILGEDGGLRERGVDLEVISLRNG